MGGNTLELRDYRLADGHVDDFISAWQGVVQLRERHGFRIEGAWVAREERRFIWLLSLDADRPEFERRNAAYYADPARAALSPDPAQWIEQSTHTIVEELAVGSGPGHVKSPAARNDSTSSS